MGDFIDDLMGIQNEFKGMQDDFSDMKSDISGKQKRDLTVREIWNADRYYTKVGIKADLCLHNRSEEADCSLCSDLCPTDALAIDDEGNLSMKDENCTGCALCTSVCPTSALYGTKADPKHIYDEIAATAASGEQAYVTCAQALRKTPPDGMVVLPCLGVMRRELWFSLLAAYDNISIYLPIGRCDECEFKVGEELYGDAVEVAEKWSRETVGFECSMKNVRFDKKHSAERKEFINSMLKTGTTLASGLNPVTAKASAALKSIDKHRRDLTGIQNTLNRLCGEEVEKETVQTLEPNRQLLLGALKAYRDLAKPVRVDLSRTDVDLCTGCGDCVRDCPLGARMLKDGVATVVNLYCTGCGLCVDVCPEGACIIEETSGKELLREMTEMEKQLAELKDKASKVASKTADKAEKLAEDDG